MSATSHTTVEKLKEQWTPTTIQAAFVVCSPRSSSSRSDSISVKLPLLNLGWAFALSLTPKTVTSAGKKLAGKSSTRASNQYSVSSWIPAAFSFRHGSTIPWGSTSMHARLSLAMEQPCDCEDASEECTPHNDIWRDLTLLGTMEVDLAHTPSVEVPIIASCTLSSHRRTKVSLTVTISKCPFANGLFQASYQVNEAEAQARLVRQSGDNLLSQTLETGKLFYVKFLTCSTRPTSGNIGELLTTYASLPVLEEHVNLSSAKLREEWKSALATLDCRDNTDAKHIGEILCPDDYDYELDSDFEDENENSSASQEGNPSTVEGQRLESSTESSSSSSSSFDLGGASGKGSLDFLPEEVIKGPGESSHAPHAFSVAAPDDEQAVLVKFAAHKTWYAFLWYCYTGRVEFSKLKSQAEPGAQRLHMPHLGDGPPPCSPKSMYRLADLVDDKPLRVKALEAIKERMTEVNVVDETFSVFTSKYPDVQEAQLNILIGYCRSPEVKKAFLRTMWKFGSMPHAEPALSAFYDRLARGSLDNHAPSHPNEPTRSDQVLEPTCEPEHSSFW